MTSIHCKPYVRPQPQDLNPKPYTPFKPCVNPVELLSPLIPKPCSQNPGPQTLNRKLQTPSPKPRRGHSAPTICKVFKENSSLIRPGHILGMLLCRWGGGNFKHASTTHWMSLTLNFQVSFSVSFHICEQGWSTRQFPILSTVTGIEVLVAKRKTVVTFGLAPGARVLKVSAATGNSGQSVEADAGDHTLQSPCFRGWHAESCKSCPCQLLVSVCVPLAPRGTFPVSQAQNGQVLAVKVSSTTKQRLQTKLAPSPMLACQ